MNSHVWTQPHFVHRNLWPFIEDCQYIEMLYDSYLCSQTFNGAEDGAISGDAMSNGAISSGALSGGVISGGTISGFVCSCSCVYKCFHFLNV
jgi:hypothetical protein